MVGVQRDAAGEEGEVDRQREGRVVEDVEQLGIDIERGAMYRMFREVRELQNLCDHPPIRHHLFGNAVTAHRDCYQSLNKQLQY